MNKVVAVVCRGYRYCIPYNYSFFHVARAAEKIAERMLLEYMNQDYAASADFQAAYVRFLEACGWTEQRYDAELLSLIDESW